MSKQLKDFVSHVKSECRENNFTLYLGKGKTVRTSYAMVGGYFDDESRIIAVATDHPLKEWGEILVHETCHMDQYLEQSRYFTPELDDAYEQLNDFFDGKVVENIEESVDKIVMMEADCERRAIKKIQEFNLPIDITTYAKKANAYLYGYRFMVQYGKWFDSSPYTIDSIVEEMSETLLAPNKYKMRYNRIDPELFKCCFNFK